MFWKPFGLALLVLVAVAGVAGTALFGVLYVQKDSGLTKGSVDATVAAAGAAVRGTAAAMETSAAQAARATATAAYQGGLAEAQKCDTIAGATANLFNGAKAGDRVSSQLTIRSTKTGQVYEVAGPVNCVVTSTGCNSAADYNIGDPWPPRCGK